MDGVLVLDKPQGITSHDAVAVARRSLRETRIGHTGTLDPLATGVLALACGRATRLVRFLTASDKEYVATIRFGLSTDTYDVTGSETERSSARPDRPAVEHAMAGLRGEYLQTPPAYSAKKIAGTRAYALARQAVQVDLTPVPVRVIRSELVDFDGECATVTLTCSAGFYVRSYAHEIGRVVGAGACLEALRRTRSGDFTLDQAISIADLQAGAGAQRIIPLDRLLPSFPAVVVTGEGRQRLTHGREVESSHVARGSSGLEAAEWVRLLDDDEHLVALATRGSRPGSLHPSLVLI